MKRFLALLALAAIIFCAMVALFHDERAAAGGERETRLEIYSMYNVGESQQRWFDTVVERFKARKAAEGQSIEVDVVYAGREVLGKLRPRLIIGNPPDLVNQGGDLLTPLVADGLLAPLDDALDSPSFSGGAAWKESFLPGLLDLDGFKGRRYLIPLSVFSTGVFYDQALFERLGLAAPETWNEFLEVCRVLRENDIEPIAADGTIADYNCMWFIALLTRTTTVERIMATATSAPGTSWTDEPFVEAARLLRDLRDSGYFMRGYEGSMWPSAQMQWIQGKCGMLYCGSWIPKEMKEKTPDAFRIGVFRFPVIEGRDDADGQTQEIGTESYGVPVLARHKDLAVEFLRFLTSPDIESELAALDSIPSIVGAPAPASLSGMEKYFLPPYRLIKWSAGINTDLSEWYRVVARDNWSRFFLGESTPEEICAKIEEAHDRYAARLSDMGREISPQ